LAVPLDAEQWDPGPTGTGARHWIRSVLWSDDRLKWLYWLGAIGLAPWIVYLYFTQPPRGLTHHVHALAVGLILAMIAGLLWTAWTYRARSDVAVIAATLTATITLISIWFRVLTQTGGQRWEGSVPVSVTLVVIVVLLCSSVIRLTLTREYQSISPARWLWVALIILALALVPSLVVAIFVVPAVQKAGHLRLAWTGLDVAELVTMAATGYALDRRSSATAVPATMTGALLACDAWINIVPSTGVAKLEAILMAFIEVPLAALSLWLAARKTGTWSTGS
jgi:hypothetical protein